MNKIVVIIITITEIIYISFSRKIGKDNIWKKKKAFIKIIIIILIIIYIYNFKIIGMISILSRVVLVINTKTEYSICVKEKIKNLILTIRKS